MIINNKHLRLSKTGITGLLFMLLAPIAMAQDISEKPDFSGIYMPAGSQRTPQQPPFTDAAQAIADQYTANFTSDDDPGKFCIPPGMPRAMWGAPFAIEIFHRPQDLTIYWEGYSMYRKVYMEDQNPPEPIIRSRMGFSLAHWEDEVLVIETDQLRTYPYMDDLPATENARIVERMFIEMEDFNGTETQFLVNEIVFTDDVLYTQPITIRARARLTPENQVLEYTCADLLWEQHLLEQGIVEPDIEGLAQ